VIDSLLLSLVETSDLNTNMRKFQSSQKDESRAQSADSSKAYRKRRAFYCPVKDVKKLTSEMLVLKQEWKKHGLRL